MRRIIFAAFAALLALIQASLFPASGLIGMYPDFVLVFLLVWSAHHGVDEGLWMAFGLGLWLDVITMERLGTHVLTMLPVAVIGSLASWRLLRSGMMLPILAVVAATIASAFVDTILTTLGGQMPEPFVATRLAIATALLNAVIVPFAWGVTLVIDRWVPRHATT